MNSISREAEEEEEEEEKKSTKEKENILDFETYMALDNQLGFKVINHKSINMIIHYLFQDNSQPPNLVWVSAEDELSEEQRKAISLYWVMISDIEKCGLPKRPMEQVKIVNMIETVSAEGKKKMYYGVTTPNLPLEFFNNRDFCCGLTGEEPLSLPIDYLEAKIIAKNMV
ncbi:hypothetical protein M9Y10_001912 [Tritrichomonas musculus]|uniref:Uncharacterized protein n=1 Tax=Tritrichomonas musculus TaxID=1915356 RepID=A0ABR2L9A6_9EUKA